VKRLFAYALLLGVGCFCANVYGRGLAAAINIGFRPLGFAAIAICIIIAAALNQWLQKRGL